MSIDIRKHLIFEVMPPRLLDLNPLDFYFGDT
jgi:hypothetical protein